MDLRDHFTVLVAKKSDGVALEYMLCINVAEGPLALTRKEGKIFQTEKQQNTQTFLLLLHDLIDAFFPLKTPPGTFQWLFIYSISDP